jgi:DNA-binding NarL/FixJ family response regulator
LDNFGAHGTAEVARFRCVSGSLGDSSRQKNVGKSSPEEGGHVKEIRILIGDKGGFIHRTVQSLLAGHPNWTIISETAGETELLAMTNETKPDVVLMDLSMDVLAGLEAVRKIRGLHTSVNIIVVGPGDEEGQIRTALESGVRGYVLKSDFALHVVRAIDAVSEGRHFLDDRVLEIVMKGYLDTAGNMTVKPLPLSRLTAREIEVVRLLAMGRGNKQVAKTLRIRVRTVETHRRNIMQKLNVHTLAELIHFAIAMQMIRVHPASHVPELRDSAVM